jgi:hypothetical protein
MVTKKKEITIDQLALMVARGFESVEKRFVNVDMRLYGLSNGISDVQQDISHAKLELKEINLRLDSIEEDVKDLAKSNKQDLNAFGLDIVKIKQKVGLK